MIDPHTAAMICLIVGVVLGILAVVAMVVLFSRDPILGYGGDTTLFSDDTEEEAGEVEEDEPTEDLDTTPPPPAAALPWRQPLHDLLDRPVATATTADAYLPENLAPRIVDADDERPGRHRHGEMRYLNLDQRARYLTHLHHLNDATMPFPTGIGHDGEQTAERRHLNPGWRATTESIPVRQLDIHDDTEGAWALFNGPGRQIHSHRAAR